MVIPWWVLPFAAAVLVVPLVMSIATERAASGTWMGAHYRVYWVFIVVDIGLIMVSWVTRNPAWFIGDLLFTKPVSKMIIPNATRQFWKRVTDSVS